MKKILTFFSVFILISAFLLTSRVFASSADNLSGAKYAPDIVLVKFAPGTRGQDKANAHASVGGKKVRSYKIVPGLEKIRIKGLSVPDAVERLSRNPNVMYAEPDGAIQANYTIPDDTNFSALWGMERIGATAAWDTTTGNGDYLIAVIDSGVDYNHPDLANNMWTNPGETPGNGVDDDGNGFVDDIHGYDFAYDDNDPMDGNGHGTHVAGTICAEGDNNIGVAGLVWHCNIMALKHLDDDGNGWYSDAITAIDYAVTMGAKLSNHSWGGDSDSTSLREAIENAGATGHLVVAAAGNNERDTDTNGHYPSAYNLDNIISVANTQSDDSLRSDSNWGAASVDLGAPGSSILSTIPNNSYAYYWGTSMAAPHVTGAVALLASQHPDWTYTQLRNTILDTVEPLDALDGLTVTGGLLDVEAALASEPTAPGISFAVIGDFGSDDSDYDERDVADLVASWYPEFVITVGDNRYGSITMDTAVGKYYCDFLADAGADSLCDGDNASTNAFFPSLGNHDYTDGGGLNEYQNYFTLPGIGIATTDTSGSERYYDFVKGPVHFFVLDSEGVESDSSDMAAQKAWLQAQLAVSAAPWQVVYFHHAPYSSGSSHGSEVFMQWPFTEWGADAVLAGHDHTYERLQIGNIPYFVNGLGGMSRYTFGTPIAGSQVRYRDNYGAMRVEANDTAMTFQFINVAGDVIDTHTILTSYDNDGVLDIRVAAGNDDVEESEANGSIYFNSSDLELGYDGYVNSDQVIGLRFLNLRIPQGATITGAYLKFTANDTGGTATTAYISAEASDSAAPFASSNYNVTDRPTTGSVVDWPVPAWNTIGQLQQSPDISILVQEVVDRSGWQSGGNMVFAIDSDYAGDREADSFEGNPGGAPLLHIEYTTDSQSNQPPTANFSFTTTDMTVNFFDTSTDDVTISSWLWSFGDSITSTSRNPIHTYDIEGTYSVEMTVTDDQGESGSIIKPVTVTAPDTMPPSITAPADVTVEATGQTTPVTLGTPTVSDDTDPNPTVSNDAPAAFPVGTTTVIWTATDASGNSATAIQTVKVIDTTAPAITAPGDISVESSDPVVVNLGTPTVSDLADSNPAVSNDAPALFLLGTTPVIWTATDASGNFATATQTVTVTAVTELPTMHVESCSGTSRQIKNKWEATVTTTVYDGNGHPVTGTTVYGLWSNGTKGDDFCTTDASGGCEIKKTRLSTRVPSVDFAVTDVELEGWIYDQADNVETTTTVIRPAN